MLGARLNMIVAMPGESASTNALSSLTRRRSNPFKPAEALAAAFLAEGIDIGRSFPPLNRWARISIGLPEENERAIGVLRKLLVTQP
jgi:histidinol-phosphate/aromatic aminotransferase/cobyric acid decarboxylase-like protein